MDEATQAPQPGRPAPHLRPPDSAIPRSTVCGRRSALGREYLPMEVVLADGLR